ncbi:hypothetical protein VNO78_01455 [Psophocarpus tetragonolobus]|uniref:Uncharacterized protein n=1 Tax=Psophocarpus tetragonolobus TaxID=3891 RepID=A0AAN9T0F9_PSOTE
MVTEKQKRRDTWAEDDDVPRIGGEKRLQFEALHVCVSVFESDANQKNKNKEDEEDEKQKTIMTLMSTKTARMPGSVGPSNALHIVVFHLLFFARSSSIIFIRASK